MNRGPFVFVAKLALCLSGAAMPALVASAADSQASNPVAAESEFEEVIVSARRKEESIQDVPLTVEAISGAELEHLSLFQFEDLSKVVSGIQLSRSGGITTVRGVSFSPVQQTNPGIAMYVNEAALQSSLVFQSMFDVEQFEVLKGPQGTLRGQSAPTGAITLATRKPDLYEFGLATASTVTDLDGSNLQGALNLPIVEGVLGLRLAAMSDRTDNGGIRSINNTADPFLETGAFRLSARYEPTDRLSALVVYQNLRTHSLSVGGSVFGNGAAGGTISNARTGYAKPFQQPVGYNGPAIPIGRRISVTENANRSSNEQEFATAQINFDFAEQQLSYVGGWSTTASGAAKNFADLGNLLPNGDFPDRTTGNELTRSSHELRLSSMAPVGGLVDYVAGVYVQKEDIDNDINNGLSFLPGAFGTPQGAPLPQAPNLAYSTASLADSVSQTQELSFFANATLHLGDRNEVSAGVRFINAEKDATRINSQTGGIRGQNISQDACTAAGGTYGGTYANVCDVPVAARVTGTIEDHYKKSPVVYSASFSHHFTPDLMAYVSHATSWRPGPTQGTIINGANDPVLASLVSLEDEKSKSIELGFKSSWWNKRLVANAAYYHQTYENLVYSSFAVPYLVDTGVPGVPPVVSVNGSLNSGIDADVDGIDVDLRFAATERWHVSGGLSWASGKYSDKIPCWDGNFDGVPDTLSGALSPTGYQERNIYIAQCAISGHSNTEAKWNGTLRSEYSRPVASGMDGFVSGLLTYTPENPYKSTSYEIPDYTLLNLYLGLRDPKAGWEIQVFAKNLTDDDTILSKSSSQVGATGLTSYFGGSGYSSIEYQRSREFGITVRYAFGSR